MEKGDSGEGKDVYGRKEVGRKEEQGEWMLVLGEMKEGRKGYEERI